MERINGNIIILSTLLCILETGCSAKPDSKFLVAQGEISVYEVFEEDSQEIKFTLLAGEKCSVGERVYAKVFAYVPVFCPGKGKGWVTLGRNFEIIEINKK